MYVLVYDDSDDDALLGIQQCSFEWDVASARFSMRNASMSQDVSGRCDISVFLGISICVLYTYTCVWKTFFDKNYILILK